MRTISLWQPWASLWLTDRKIHETREWATAHRGWLGVHATKKFVKDIDGPLRDILDDEFGGHWAMDLDVGAVIGMVYLQGCKRMPIAVPAHEDDRVCGDWSDGRYAWRRSHVMVLDHPIPYRGMQSMFNVPELDAMITSMSMSMTA